MTAKDLKQKAKVETHHTAYYFTEAELDAFIEQLCKEQRENCYAGIKGYYRSADMLETLINNAKQPEI